MEGFKVDLKCFLQPFIESWGAVQFSQQGRSSTLGGFCFVLNLKVLSFFFF